MFLSVIIPAYNEEKRLPETLKKVKNYLEKQKYTYEVIVVDDGSTDKMKEVVENLIDGWENFHILSYKPNQGKGYAVKTGMLTGRGEWRLLMDADNSTDIAEVEKLFDSASRKLNVESRKLIATDQTKPSCDVIIGSRYLKADSIKIKQPLIRRIVSRMGNIIVRVLLGIKSADTQCGFKLFSDIATQDIFPLQTIKRWGFDVEILAIAIKKKYKIIEVPVDWYDDENSRVKKTAIFKTLGEIWTVKKNMMRGKYGK